MNATTLRARLAGLPVTELRWFEKTGSTNDVAMTWAGQGAADWSLVAANTQENGRGRFNRRWITPSGAALAFSLILRPVPVEAARVGLFSALGALGVREALLKLHLPVEIKWPNDVLIGGRKVCGILAEAAWQGGQVQAVVLGIGINVSPEAVPQAGEALFPAISVEEGTGHPVDRFDLLREVIAGIASWRERFDTDEFHAAWGQNLAFAGQMVQITATGSAPLTGRLEGIDREGNLTLRVSGGKIICVMAGDVHLRPETPTE